MDNSANKIFEQLVSYLDGVLTEDDTETIEKRLAIDSVVLAEYESLVKTRAAIQHYGLKCKVAEVHKKMMVEIQQTVKQRGKTRRIIRYTMAAAASLVLLISGYVAYNSFTSSSDKIFTSNYHTYQLSVTRDVSDVLTPVERAYGEKNYKEVLRIHDAKEDKTAKAEFLTGVASLELRNNSKAIKCFNEVIEMNTGAATPVLHDESEYYLALAYIKNKDYDYALTLLNKISENDEHKYRREISPKLIRQVQKLKQL
jgi:hypothetical protein